MKTVEIYVKFDALINLPIILPIIKYKMDAVMKNYMVIEWLITDESV